jgi:hypothetical protein
MWVFPCVIVLLLLWNSAPARAQWSAIGPNGGGAHLIASDSTRPAPSLPAPGTHFSIAPRIMARPGSLSLSVGLFPRP